MPRFTPNFLPSGPQDVTLRHYHLEGILAVGFRVRSHRGTQFRQWATARLNEFLVKGNGAGRKNRKVGAPAFPVDGWPPTSTEPRTGMWRLPFTTWYEQAAQGETQAGRRQRPLRRALAQTFQSGPGLVVIWA